MKILDSLRTLLRIRKERQLPPITAKPQVGGSIVKDRLRIRLNYPISNDQWTWLVDMGWRTVNTRTDRRSYTLVSDQYVRRILEADEELRYQLHQRLILNAQLPGESKKT